MTTVKPGKIYFVRTVICKHGDSRLTLNLPPAKFVTALEKAGWNSAGAVWTCPNDHSQLQQRVDNEGEIVLGQIHMRPEVECAADGTHRMVGRWVIARGPENDKTLTNRLTAQGWYQKNNFWFHPLHRNTKPKKNKLK